MFEEAEVTREVECQISLTSENPSEADEDLPTTRNSSFRTATDRIPNIPKKRFASDVSIEAKAQHEEILKLHQEEEYDGDALYAAHCVGYVPDEEDMEVARDIWISDDTYLSENIWNRSDNWN